jgi:hypothetical protein
MTLESLFPSQPQCVIYPSTSARPKAAWLSTHPSSPVFIPSVTLSKSIYGLHGQVPRMVCGLSIFVDLRHHMEVMVFKWTGKYLTHYRRHCTRDECMGPVTFWTAAHVVKSTRAFVAGPISADPAVLAGRLVNWESELVAALDRLLPPAQPRCETARAAKGTPNASLSVHEAKVEGPRPAGHGIRSSCSASADASLACRWRTRIRGSNSPSHEIRLPSPITFWSALT